MEAADNYQFNYDKLLRFLNRGASGYVFAMADDFRFIPQINNSLVQDLEVKGVDTGIVFLDGKSDVPLMYQIKQASLNKRALIVANLYEIVNDAATGKNNLLHLNFSREELQELPTAILFWVDKISIGVISNVAVDLFSQRSFTTVHFTGTVEHPVEEVLQRDDWQEFVSTERFREIEARIETLRRRLQDAEKANYPVNRIIEEIALPLAKEYADLGISEKAIAILEQYNAFINTESYTQLEQLAHIYYSLHQYQQAIYYLQQANAILQKNETVYELWFENTIDVSDWMIEFGMLAEAKSALKEALLLLNENLDKYPDQNSFNYIKGIMQDRLESIAISSGDIEEAKLYAEQNLLTIKTLFQKNPNRLDFNRDLGVSYSKLGDIERDLGNFQKAKDYYSQSLTIADKLTAISDHKQLERDMAGVYNRLGDIDLFLGNLQEAKKYYDQSLSIRVSLIRNNPYNVDLKRELGVTYSKLGNVEMSFKNVKAAKGYYQKLFETAVELLNINPTSEHLRRDLVSSYTKLSLVAEAEHNFSKALDQLKIALPILQSLSNNNPSSQILKNDIEYIERKIEELQ